MRGGGGGGSGRMTSEQFFFCCYNRSAIFFFWACAVQIFFIVFFSDRGEGGGVLKLGLNVFHHNNNFNLINIYSAKTITIEYKKLRVYWCFALQFFFHNVACANFFNALLGLCKFFFTNSSIPPPPPPPHPPRDQLVRPLRLSEIPFFTYIVQSYKFAIFVSSNHLAYTKYGQGPTSTWKIKKPKKNGVET